MARRTTYMYEVKATKPGELGLTFFVYARNQKAAVDGLKQMDNGLMKHWHFDAKCFGEVAYEKHPELFKLFDEKEKAAAINGELSTAEAYARRKDKPIWADGEFVPVEATVGVPVEEEKEE